MTTRQQLQRLHTQSEPSQARATILAPSAVEVELDKGPAGFPVPVVPEPVTLGLPVEPPPTAEVVGVDDSVVGLLPGEAVYVDKPTSQFRRN